jgi:putative flavoprotein involved in K+ transport
LLRAGRRVILSVSRHRRTPRRYRAHDHVWWWIETGLDQTPVEKRPTDQAPVVHTGAYGGETIDFRDFAARGMVLVGKVAAAEGGVVRFADDLIQNLAHGDAAYLAFMDFVDAHIARTGMNLPEDPAARRIPPMPPSLADAPRHLDLLEEGVTSIIWATGYGMDFSWIDVPVFDRNGLLVHRGGVTEVSGLYFIGMPFLSRMSSSFLFGVGQDAVRLAEVIAGRA